MNEEEWLTGTDPTAMLTYLNRPQRDRRLFMFLLACCRNIWPLLLHPGSRKGVDLTERYAEGDLTASDLGYANWDVEGAAFGINDRTDDRLPGWVDEVDALPREVIEEMAGNGGEHPPAEPWVLLSSAAYFVDHVMSLHQLDRHDPADRLNRRFHSVPLIREVFGNPFRPVTADPRWLTSTAVGLARSIYQDRAWDRMPILADALQDAGCEHPDILAHLRSPGPHVRGCWAVDLVLGKG